MFKQTLSASAVRKSGPRLLLAAAFLAALGTSCARKPDSALCGQYYSRLVQLSAGAHPAIVAATRTGEGKQAIVEYCLQLARSQAKCSIAAGTLQDAVDCEQAEKKTFFEKYF